MTHDYATASDEHDGMKFLRYRAFGCMSFGHYQPTKVCFSVRRTSGAQRPTAKEFDSVAPQNRDFINRIHTLPEGIVCGEVAFSVTAI